MPRRPLTECTWPACTLLVPRPGRCSAHRSALMRIYNREPARRSAMSAYGGNWSALRRVVLLEEPTCRGWPAGTCSSPSTDVDHIVPLRAGGERSDRANLQALCSRCHRRKTAAEHRGAGGRFVRRP